ncbi:hypothetical protein B0H10DRAFT_2210116 [Mycena sp. CBHHK59/15]|nr:hypothetical protein B0H10DRAFT_2210116 [Mycena sp. CBHHK59/15]
MPDDVCHRIIRNRERQAQLAEDESSDSDRGAANVAATAFTNNSHIATATVDLPTKLNINMMDPTIHESVLGTYAVPYPPPDSFVDQPPTPPSPTLTTSTSSVATGTPKKEKKKKNSTTTNEVQVALKGMSLNEAEEDEFSM